MRKLILVRHSLTEIEPSVPAVRWHLSQEGGARCTALAHSLKRHVAAHIVSSEEVKAVEPAQLVAGHLGLSIEISDGLQEHDRTGVPHYSSKDEHQREVARVFANPDQLGMGRGTAVEAAERFADALEGVIRTKRRREHRRGSARNRDIVICSRSCRA